MITLSAIHNAGYRIVNMYPGRRAEDLSNPQRLDLIQLLIKETWLIVEPEELRERLRAVRLAQSPGINIQQKIHVID